MAKKIKKSKNNISDIQEREGKKFKHKRKVRFKNRLYPKIDLLINKIKEYQNPNEYTRQDQDQRLSKYINLPPIEYNK